MASKQFTIPYGVPPLTPAETKLRDQMNAGRAPWVDPSNAGKPWSSETALAELRYCLQIAVTIELATIPVYLYTYYSINRTIGDSTTPAGFPNSDVSRFADRAGAVIMSVAVEEMLHMSLSSNVLFSLGQAPQLYQQSPGPYPTNLPGHARLGPDHRPLQIPLSRFSAEHLWNFLEIEYPAVADAPPEGENWETIGQIYSYVRCIISTDWISDADFRAGDTGHQIQPTNYAPNNIDGVYPRASFDKANPVPAPAPGSAASVAVFTSREDSHVGPTQLLTVQSREDAMRAIATICFQGEGFDHTRFDDPRDQELSHYYKFLTLQSELEGYPFSRRGEPLPEQPPPPPPASRQYSEAELATFVVGFPDNPVARDYPAGYCEVANLASGLYQYMLIMTETIFRVPPDQQKTFFNQTMHMSMIWILDKFIQSMRTVAIGGGEYGGTFLAPTFENYDLGTRQQAFAKLKKLGETVHETCKDAPWYKHAGLDGYVTMISQLPDVSGYWAEC